MSVVALRISPGGAAAPDHGEAMRIAEALLFASAEPLARTPSERGCRKARTSKPC